MELIIDSPGGSRVDARFGRFIIQTDQEPEMSAPTPLEVFLTSLGTYAGIHVPGFCRQRALSTDGLRITQRVERDSLSRMVERIALEIRLPPGFPEKHRHAIVHSAQKCAVKKHLEHSPACVVTTSLDAVAAPTG